MLMRQAQQPIHSLDRGLCKTLSGTVTLQVGRLRRSACLARRSRSQRTRSTSMGSDASQATASLCQRSTLLPSSWITTKSLFQILDYRRKRCCSIARLVRRYFAWMRIVSYSDGTASSCERSDADHILGTLLLIGPSNSASSLIRRSYPIVPAGKRKLCLHAYGIF